MAEKNESPPESDRALEISRVFDAPRRLVYELWTSPRHMLRWWGPRDGERDFTTPVCEMDFRPGGSYRICIRSPDGKDYWQRGEYREIVPAERLVFSFAWDMPGEALHDTLVTVGFADHGPNRTLLTFRQAPFDSAQGRDGHRVGWDQCLDRLAAHLAQREIR